MGCSGSKPVEAKPVEAKTTPSPVVPAANGTSQTDEERALVQLKLCFDSIDANADGAVSKTELAAALEKDAKIKELVQAAGMNPNYAIMEKLDTNADGRVTWDEFKAHMKAAAVAEVERTGNVAAAEAPAEEKAVAQLEALFRSLDANADGAVSKKELQTALQKDANLVALIKEAGLHAESFVLEQLDVNDDGRVTWQEFEYSLKDAAVEEVKTSGDVAAVVQQEQPATSDATPVVKVEGEASWKTVCCM